MIFNIKTLNTDDAANWKKLRYEGARDFPLGFLITKEEAAEITKARAQEILGIGSMRGVFYQHKLVGFCGYRPEHLERTRHRAEIGPLFITAEFQGKGAALALMEAVIEEAAVSGIELLELFVDTENHRAINFYEKLGFKRIATHLDGVRIDGVSRDDYFYCLKLDQV